MFDNLNNLDGELKTMIGDIGVDLLAKTQYKTPVDTGKLRRAWELKSGDMQVEVFNKLDYATYVENGTRHQAGIHMLERSVEEIVDELDEKLDVIIEEVFR